MTLRRINMRATSLNAQAAAAYGTRYAIASYSDLSTLSMDAGESLSIWSDVDEAKRGIYTVIAAPRTVLKIADLPPDTAAAFATNAAASASTASGHATDAGTAADRAEAARDAAFDALAPLAFRTQAAAVSGAAAINNGTIFQIVEDETHSDQRWIWWKTGGVLEAIGPALTACPPFAFDNLPDPAGYYGAGMITVTGERYGATTCFTDGVVWYRHADRRPAQSAAVTYYIDPTGGNDANAGTATGTAVKTETRVLALINARPAYRRSGLRIAWLRGTVSKDELTGTAEMAGIICQAYGAVNLARPIGDCADVVPNANFTAHPSISGLWQHNLAPQVKSAPAEIPSYWRNGRRLSYVTSTTLSAAQGETFTHSNPNGLTTVPVDFNPGAGINPTSDGALYETAIRASWLDMRATPFAEFHNLHGKRNYSSYGSIADGQNAIWRNVLCEDGSAHNLIYGSGADMEGVVAKNANAGWGLLGSPFIGYDNPMVNGGTARLVGCAVEMTENSNKPRFNVSAVGIGGTTTITLPGHTYIQGEYIIPRNLGGAVWLNDKTVYVSAVVGDVLTLQIHDPVTNRVQGWNSTGSDAWTSGGYCELAPVAISGTVGMLNHGPVSGSVSWASLDYIRPKVQGCSTGISSGEVDRCNIVDAQISDFAVGIEASAYGNVFLYAGSIKNRLAVVGAKVAVVGANGSIWADGRQDVEINSTGYWQVTGNNAKLTLLPGVKMRGCLQLVRVLSGVNQVIDVQGIENIPNPNVAQFNLFDIAASSTSLTWSSDLTRFGGYAGGFVYQGTSHASLSAWISGTGNDVQCFPEVSQYTITNPATLRAFDTASVTTANLAKVVGTVIADLRGKGIFI